MEEPADERVFCKAKHDDFGVRPPAGGSISNLLNDLGLLKKVNSRSSILEPQLVE
jgi:hypothetical protein